MDNKTSFSSFTSEYHESRSTILNNYGEYRTLKSKYLNYLDFVSDLKRMGYDMWYTIPLLFNSIYPEHKIINLSHVEIENNRNIAYQQGNDILGIMCYILVNDGYISNTNIFKNFNN